MPSPRMAGKASLVRILIIWGAFSLFPATGKPALYFDFDLTSRQAFQKILSLRFSKANELIRLEKRAAPQNLVPAYLDHYLAFLSVFLSEDVEEYNKMSGGRAGWIRLLESGPAGDPLKRYLLAQCHLQWAFTRLKFRDYTRAAGEIRKAGLLLRANDEAFPSFLPNKLGMGVLHATLGMVPDNYKWLAGLLGVPGDVEKGMREIKTVAGYNGPDPLLHLIRVESSFILVFLTMNMGAEDHTLLPGLATLSEAGSLLPDTSPLLLYATASLYAKAGKNDEALKTIRIRHQLNDCSPFPYLDLLEGVYMLNSLDLNSAFYFRKYLAEYRGKSYVGSAMRRLAWISLLKGDTSGYRACMVRLASGSPGAAEEESRKGRGEGRPLPDQRLLKARLLCDGGYYAKALSELLDHPVHDFIDSKQELLEYSYRLGRIFQGMGETAKATEYFRTTVSQGSAEPWYFAASASLQMGIMYEAAGQADRARECYKKVLGMDPQEYKASLRQKAKAGLARLEGRVKT